MSRRVPCASRSRSAPPCHWQSRRSRPESSARRRDPSRAHSWWRRPSTSCARRVLLRDPSRDRTARRTAATTRCSCRIDRADAHGRFVLAAVVALVWCAVALTRIVGAHSQAPAARDSAAPPSGRRGGRRRSCCDLAGSVTVDVVAALVQPRRAGIRLAAAPELLTWRTRLRVRTLASDLSAGFERDGVAGHLQRAMADPSVRLAFPARAGRVHRRRAAYRPSWRATARRRSSREDGEPIAVLEHAPSSSSLIEAAVNPAVTIAAENERLHAEAQAHLAELQQSRRRIVERADETRRHLERDLHDGAQQQLLLLGLELARTAEAADPGQRDRYLGGARSCAVRAHRAPAARP